VFLVQNRFQQFVLAVFYCELLILVRQSEWRLIFRAPFLLVVRFDGVVFLLAEFAVVAAHFFVWFHGVNLPN
jgi:hypothetical protein